MASILARAFNFVVRRGNSSGASQRHQESPGVSNSEILPPFGTKEPVRVTPTKPTTDLGKRTIGANPFDGFYLTLPAKLQPQQILNILRATQGGDVWQQAQLHDLMLTLWPMYKKCVCELKEAVCSVKFDIHPYCEDGEEPTAKAKEKADFVRRCLFEMSPNPANDEKDFHGTIYHLADALLMGVGMQEIIWNDAARGKDGWERVPRATTFVHPRHFTYTADGFLTVFDENYSRYQFNTSGNAVYAPDPDRFICSQYYSHQGSSLPAGLIRPLGRWFSMWIYNQEWITNTAQQHGGPFLDIIYAAGTPPDEITKMEQYAKNAASNRYIMHLEGTTVAAMDAKNLAADNPQRYLAEEADKQCQLLILGQTLTSDMPKSGQGSYAASKTHANVRQDRIESLARWVAHGPLKQFIRAILRVNYGDETECPHCHPDFTPTLEPAEKASLITAISSSQMPFIAREIYKLLGFDVPEEGDGVLIGGKLGELGPTDDELSAIGLQGVEEIDQQLEVQEQQAKIAKKYATKPQGKKPTKASEMRRLLIQASDEDVQELKELVTKAKSADHINGEWEAVEIKIDKIKEKARFKV